MHNSDYSKNRHNEHLGVNKIGKNIKKSPSHQPSFVNPARQQPQPQVYNINKNDFRNVVQQLTGSPSRNSLEPLPRPPQNSPKPSSLRLQRIRPPPLANMNVKRPQMMVHRAPQMPPYNGQRGGVSYGNSNLARPPQYNPPMQQDMPPMQQAMPLPTMSSGDHTAWGNTAESPISAYMRYLKHSVIDSVKGQPQPQQQPHPQYQQHSQGQSQMQSQQPQSSGLVSYPPPLPSPGMNHPPLPPHPSPRMNCPPPPLPSPRMNGPPPPLPLPPPRMNGPPPFPSPRMNGPPPSLPSPRMNGPPLPSPRINGLPPPSPRMKGPPPPLPSPRFNGPPPLPPSPTSQFLLPSPSGYFNLPSPLSPYPPLSPGYQFPPPLTPNFSFSPFYQSGVPQPPPSPGLNFPLSPSFFSMLSPRWKG